MKLILKSTKAEDVKIGDVMVISDLEDKTFCYYYFQAETVFVGEIADAIYDLDNNYVGDRKTHGVEICWKPLARNSGVKDLTLRYKTNTTIDVVANTDLSNLPEKEDGEE